MADKRISQLIERVDIANNDVLPIVASGASTTNKVTISTIQDWMQENLDVGVTSVGITLGTSGTDVNVTGSPITTSGNITINIPTASATNRGLLSSADWSTFNDKQPAGNYVTLDTTQTITAHKTFTASGGQASITINHSNGAGHALDITKAGNGEGIRVVKSSGTGNAMTIIGSGNSPALSVQKSSGLGDALTITGGSLLAQSANFVGNIWVSNGVQLSSTGGALTTNLQNISGTGLITSGANGIGFNGSNNFFFSGSDKGCAVFVVNNTGTRNYTLQDASGTLAFTSQIPSNPVGGTGTTNVVPIFTGTSTIGDSSISDNANEVNIAKRTFITSGVHQFVFTPNLSSTSNRIETLGGLPLEITTNGSSIGLNVGGGSSQFSMTNTSATFTIPVTSNGQGATSPAFIANNSTGASGTAQHYINFTAGTTTIARMLRGNGASGLAGDGLNIDNFGGFGIRLNQLGGSAGTFSVTGGAATFGGTLGVTGQAAFGTSVNTTHDVLIQGTTSNNTKNAFRVQNSSAASLFAVRNDGVIDLYNNTTVGGTLSVTGAATFSSSVTANGAKPQLYVIGNGINGAGISLNTGLSGTDRRNWFIGTEENVAGDFTIKCSTAAGGNANAGDTRLAILNNGNVGIGTPSPSFSNTGTGLNVQSASGDGAYLKVNYSGGNSAEFRTGFSIAGIGNVSDNPFQLFTNNTERMRITSGGNVGIGTTTAASALSGSARVLSIVDNSTANVGSVRVYGGGTATSLELYGGASAVGLFGSTDHPMTFSTNSAERMRITSGGFLKASNTGSYSSGTGSSLHEFNSNQSDTVLAIFNNASSITSARAGVDVYYTNATPNTTNAAFYQGADNGGGSGRTLRFEVRSNGGIGNYQANDVNLSDERTKKDIEPLESYWDKFKEIEIVKFKYKDQTHDDFNIGVIAQQVEAVAPEFVDVDGWDTKPELDEEGNEIVSEEEPLKSIYTADLYHASIKVLQEAMTKIEKLEAEIEALKSQING